MGTKGQVVIPKPLRDRLGLRPGDELDFSLDGDAITVSRSATPGFLELRGTLPGTDMAARLLEDRRAERD